MTTYRNSSYSLLIAVVAGLFAAASVTAAIVRDEPGLSAGGRWGPTAVVCLFSLFCWLRLARAGVYADEQGIRVVNPLQTVRVPWDRIMRVTVRASKGFPAVGFAEMHDGTRVQMWGIQSRSASVPAKRVPEELVEQLNERLARERERRAA